MSFVTSLHELMHVATAQDLLGSNAVTVLPLEAVQA